MHYLFSVVRSHAQNLDKADEDVYEVKLEADGFCDGIIRPGTCRSQAPVLKNLLRAVL